MIGLSAEGSITSRSPASVFGGPACGGWPVMKVTDPGDADDGVVASQVDVSPAEGHQFAVAESSPGCELDQEPVPLDLDPRDEQVEVLGFNGGELPRGR